MAPPYSFVGEVVLVTGSTRNVGFALAKGFAAAGASVVVNGRRSEDVERAVRSLSKLVPDAPGTLCGLAADITKPAEVEAMFRAIDERFGKLDVLVNNACDLGLDGHFLEVPDDAWDRVLGVNVTGMLRCTQQAARRMRRVRKGAVINISSNGATRAHRNRVAYDASKGAIEAATRAIALDLAPYGIRVNALTLGAVRTERWEGLSEAEVARRRSVIPLGVEVTGEDVAAAALFLAGPGAGNITGASLVVDGGMAAQLRPAPLEVAERS